jgi:hypothetical protein
LDAANCTPPPGWCDGDDGDGDDDDNDSDTGEWVVAGTVYYGNNKPGSGLIVHLFNKKEEKDVATAKTGRTGMFKFSFTTEKDPALFKLKPDLFVVITDSNNENLYHSEASLTPKVGGVEELKIIVK